MKSRAYAKDGTGDDLSSPHLIWSRMKCVFEKVKEKALLQDSSITFHQKLFALRAMIKVANTAAFQTERLEMLEEALLADASAKPVDVAKDAQVIEELSPMLHLAYLAYRKSETIEKTLQEDHGCEL